LPDKYDNLAKQTVIQYNNKVKRNSI